MKYLLLITLFSISLVAYADNGRVSPGIYDYSSAQRTVNSLKRYIQQAKVIIQKYEAVLNDYEYTLIGFSRLRKTCSSYGTSFTSAQQWAGCNRDVSNLSNKLRKIATRLDTLEVRIIRTKQHIKNASNILIGIGKKKQLDKQADSIIAELDRVERRNADLDREAGL